MDMRRLGAMCKQYRKYTLKVSQRELAGDIGVTGQNVSAFERGRNNNARILLWYIEHGIDIANVIRGCNNGKQA